MEILFWTSVALVGFSYAGYPLLLAIWTGAREALGGLRYLTAGGDRRRRRREDHWPSVTVVFAAFDEERCIRQKVENCLALDYPPEKLEVLVGCDGCTDRTAELARAAGGDRVRVVELPYRAGKASVLTRLVPGAKGELVVFTDANVMVERGALRALARHFQDPGVGVVVGRLRLYNRVRRDYEESLYWSYETLIKYYEGKQGLVLGANGGIYAMRRILFHPLDPTTITDDFVGCVQVAARGWRVPFEPEAVAFEETTEDYGREFGRKARIGAGNWQALTFVPQLLDPRLGFLCFSFVSHKLLRWVAPFLLAAAFVSSAVLAARGLLAYQGFLALQIAFYSLALGGLLGAGGPARRLMSTAHYFVVMNAALVVGLWRFLRHSQSPAWTRTARNA
ncbi:MAG TPA: glycosyltransferase family 2 protein [Anaeromyxobacteraceae bacterium]|jgi:cellulose synthase/poly-beta-1,6-N-acetylglucosamine synthase-like glycosyltransferase|nr:glycosyltransferase family 2 protein [Anaeromyxobacteraceae bacterium]